MSESDKNRGSVRFPEAAVVFFTVSGAKRTSALTAYSRHSPCTSGPSTTTTTTTN